MPRVGYNIECIILVVYSRIFITCWYFLRCAFIGTGKT